MEVFFVRVLLASVLLSPPVNPLVPGEAGGNMLEIILHLKSLEFRAGKLFLMASDLLPEYQNERRHLANFNLLACEFSERENVYKSGKLY